MKCVILCAGYGTRLGELTRVYPKPLLPIAGRPMVEYVLDQLRAAGVTSGVLVSNHRYYDQFVRWAATGAADMELQVIDDGTTSNETRLGAVGDLDLALRMADIHEDFLVINGDNLFTFPLRPVMNFFFQRGNTIVLYDVGSKEVARQMGMARLDASGRVVGFVEKPQEPETTCVSIGIYVYHREVRALVRQYLAEGNPPDRTGDFVAWLYPRVPVYGFHVPTDAGIWYDIGTPEQYREADEHVRRLLRLSSPLSEGGG
jgi:glucose-1-phosphate thymidylyltransferase